MASHEAKCMSKRKYGNVQDSGQPLSQICWDVPRFHDRCNRCEQPHHKSTAYPTKNVTRPIAAPQTCTGTPLASTPPLVDELVAEGADELLLAVPVTAAPVLAAADSELVLLPVPVAELAVCELLIEVVEVVAFMETGC